MAITPSGHVEQLPSGSWRAKVYAGKEPLTGREIRFRRTCKTEAEQGQVRAENARSLANALAAETGRLEAANARSEEWSARMASTREIAGKAKAELQRRGQQPPAGEAPGPQNMADWWRGANRSSSSPGQEYPRPRRSPSWRHHDMEIEL